jgi:zinc transport system substrate-binding protein
MCQFPRLALLPLVALVAVACVAPPAAAPGGNDALQVTVSVLPQKYLVERIGGGRVAANVMVGPGDEPHSYEPRPEQLRALSRSVAYLATGVEFEDAWMSRIADANRAMEIVDTTAGIERVPLAGHAGEMDPHVWVSPRRARIQAENIHDALARLDPVHAEEYAANLAALLADIDDLEGEMRAALDGARGRRFLVFHPAWGYIAEDFGLVQVAIEVGGQEPSAAEMADILALARTEGIHVVFAQPSLSTRAAETIAAEIGGRVVLVDPLAEDWLNNLRTVASALAEAFAEE